MEFVSALPGKEAHYLDAEFPVCGGPCVPELFFYLIALYIYIYIYMHIFRCADMFELGFHPFPVSDMAVVGMWLGKVEMLNDRKGHRVQSLYSGVSCLHHSNK
jgi:hypothetical protein